MYHKGKNLVTIQTHKAQVNVQVVYLFHWGVFFVGLPTSRLKTGEKIRLFLLGVFWRIES